MSYFLVIERESRIQLTSTCRFFSAAEACIPDLCLSIAALNSAVPA